MRKAEMLRKDAAEARELAAGIVLDQGLKSMLLGAAITYEAMAQRMLAAAAPAQPHGKKRGKLASSRIA
jgi:hypothetical protein